MRRFCWLCRVRKVMILPVDFLICGTQKGGTSALDALCRHHPELQMATDKELHFFDNDALFADGIPSPGDYERYFPPGESGKLRGESTPVYMYWPAVPARIHQYNPAMKLIVLLRNPITRAYSHWQMEFRRGHETLPFTEAIRREAERLAAASPDERRVYSYLDRGRYTAQLETLWSLFGKAQVLVLPSESLKSDQAGVLAQVSRFLGVAMFPPLADAAVNTQHYGAPMAEADRQFLREAFREEIAGLESALDWDLSGWC